MSQFITIRTFTLPHEAAAPMGRLESEGIECFLQDGSLSGSMTMNMSSSVRLMVEEKNVSKAAGLLKEWGYLQEEDLDPTVEGKPPMSNRTLIKAILWTVIIVMLLILSIILSPGFK